MGKILVAGSIAYDHLMTFAGEFRDSILAEKDLRHLSVSFLAESDNFSFGGCAPNICYNLALLGDSSALVGVAGADFPKYEKRLNKLGVDTVFVSMDNSGLTATAYILTDKNQAQISIFSPGVINDNKIGFDLKKIASDRYKYGIVSPELPDRMCYWAKHFEKSGIPYILDPGQAIPALTKAQLAEMSRSCRAVILNEYEAQLFENKLGIGLEKLAENKDFVIKTLGVKGCQAYAGKIFSVPSVPGLFEVDSTGCGDAFRAGVLHGITSGFSLKKACEMGNTAASFAIGTRGTQNHFYTMDAFLDRLTENYGK